MQSLISLEDLQIELITATVSDWCKGEHCDIDSHEGRRAVAAAIDLIQTGGGDNSLERLNERMVL